MDVPISHNCLHERVLAGDPAAPPELCEALLEPLIARLSRRHRFACPHLVEQAAHDALLGYIEAPDQFDPSRGTLLVFLQVAADGDLRNALRREGRHERRRIPGVELYLVEWNTERAESPLDALVRAEDNAAAEEQLRRLHQGCCPVEQGVLGLMLRGERSTEAFAQVMGTAGLPAAEQARLAKRMKDKLKKRALRGGASDGAA